MEVAATNGGDEGQMSFSPVRIGICFNGVMLAWRHFITSLGGASRCLEVISSFKEGHSYSKSERLGEILGYVA